MGYIILKLIIKKQQIHFSYLRTWVICICCLLFSVLIFAQWQDQDYQIKYFSLQNGLAQAEIKDIAESKDGMIWLATEHGLVKYDGHTFTTFEYNIDDTTTISDNNLLNIEFDKHGRIWCSTYNGLDVFDTKTSKATRLLKDNLYNGKRFEIRKLKYDDQSDEMWISTSKFLFVNKGYALHPQLVILPKGLHPSFTLSDWVKDGHIMWLAAPYGLAKWNTITNDIKVIHHTSNKTGKDGDGFLNIFKDNDGIFWIGNWSLGMTRYDSRTETMSNFTYRDPGGQNSVFKIGQHPDHKKSNLLIACTMHGLRIFDKNKNAFIASQPQIPDHLNNIIYFSFHSSATSGLWFGTRKGLIQYRTHIQNIKFSPLTLSLKDSLSDVELIGWERSKHGEDSILWYLPYYGDINKYDLINGKKISLPENLREYCSAKKELYNALLTKNNMLWITSKQDLLIGYNLHNGQMIKPECNYENPIAILIKEDIKNRIWLGTIHGLYFVDPHTMKWEACAVLNNKLKEQGLSDRIIDFEFDQYNRLWIIAGWNPQDASLIYYDPENNKTIIYKQKDNKLLRSLNTIEDIDLNKVFVFVVGNNGIIKCRFDEKGLISMSPIDDKLKISKILMRSINVVNDHQLWIANNHGFLQYDINNNQIVKFNYLNSNIDKTIFHFTYDTTSRKIYFNSTNKIIYLNVDSLIHVKPRKVHLTALQISNYYIDTIPTSGSQLILKPTQNSFDLQFSNFSFANSDDIIYLYKINNQAEWKKMNANKLSLVGLSSGSYYIRVISSNEYGTVNEDAFEITIHIQPHFYETWWFTLLCILITSGLIYLYYQRKLKEIERLNKIRSNIARNLHDDMGSNLSHIKLLSEMEAMKKPDVKSFHIIASKMSEVMNNMSEIIWNANPKNDKIEDVLFRIQEYAISTLEPLSYNVKIDYGRLYTRLVLDIEQKRHLYLIFKEAINNIGKYAHGQHVYISAWTAQNNIVISIQDDGKGFNNHISSSGNGLINMKERANHLKSQLSIHSTESGTVIKLSIPSR